MTKVLLVRHGETDWNRKEVSRGRIDVKLNQNGREQAKSLAKATGIYRIDAIYSSPLSRSLETAKMVADMHSLDVKVANGFIDIHYGQWQGLGHEKVKEEYPELYLLLNDICHLRQTTGNTLESDF